MGSETISDADLILKGQKQPEADPENDADASSEESKAERAGTSRHGGALRWGSLAILLIALGFVGLGVWWSFQPAKFDVAANTEALSGVPAGEIAGVTTVSTVIKVADTLLNKPGGYLTNDVTPPGILMDNTPQWEYGLLTELRDSIRSLRNDFSRSQTQSIENADLKRADSKFNFDAEAWFLPSAEEEYKEGLEALESYLSDLAERNPSARFYTRADNLRAYLMVVEKRLGSYGQRLSASVGDDELTAALQTGGMPADGASLQQQGGNRTDFFEIDNVFEPGARGRALSIAPVQQYLEALHADLLEIDDGAIASYIPELTRADPNWLGIALVTVDGHVYQAGDSGQPCYRAVHLQGDHLRAGAGRPRHRSGVEQGRRRTHRRGVQLHQPGAGYGPADEPDDQRRCHRHHWLISAEPRTGHYSAFWTASVGTPAMP
jgi:hypothetical protein